MSRKDPNCQEYFQEGRQELDECALESVPTLTMMSSRNKRTEFEERMIVAMAVQIGIIAVMNTHQYSFNGKTFLQKAGGPIGLRATCAILRVVMNTWDTK